MTERTEMTKVEISELTENAYVFWKEQERIELAEKYLEKLRVDAKDSSKKYISKRTGGVK